MKKGQYFFLISLYALGLLLRSYPRLGIDPHLLTFQGDIWYRLSMAQYILDHMALPNPDLRYIAYGEVPMWYPPLSPLFLAGLSLLTGFDLPTVSSRIIPFIEALTPLSIFYLARHLFDELTGYLSALILALTPSFVFWTGISDPQSLTLFLIPLYVLLWLRHLDKPEKKNLFVLSLLLALNFLVHLSYFVAVLVLLNVTMAMIIAKKGGLWMGRDLLGVVLLSQLFTLPWWLPDNLYWWWIKALVTSSGLYSASWQLQDYGILSALFGLFGATYIIYIIVGEGDKSKYGLLLLFWMIPLFIESQNEALLTAVNRIELTWTTLAKPLEGFRFFPFLAQPLSIGAGALVSRISVLYFPKKDQFKVLLLCGVGMVLLWGLLGPYDITTRFQTSGLTVPEYEGAVWYRENSGENVRITADYYRAQMLSGVTGGRSLDGGMFPLRNTDLPFISVPAVVQDDLYILYNTSDPGVAYEIAGKYNVTHIFYSRNMEFYGNLLSRYRPASQYGVPVDKEKFREPYFERAYEDPVGDVVIYKVKKEEK